MEEERKGATAAPEGMLRCEGVAEVPGAEHSIGANTVTVPSVPFPLASFSSILPAVSADVADTQRL